jgi:glyoxylase-like metal-dependent hydrolase (beta-lactamase superfamily II)
VSELGDNATIDACDVRLQVLATPGPAPEHLAFLIGERQFAVTGDLDGRRGARSVPGPSDDASWARSVAQLRSGAPDAFWLGGHPSIDSRS